MKFVHTYEWRKLLNQLFVLYAFMVPFNRGIPVITLMIIIVWLLAQNQIQNFKILRLESFFIILTLFMGYHFISLIWSDHLVFSLNYIRKYWYLLIIPIFYTSFQRKYTIKILHAYLVSILISTIISCLSYWKIIEVQVFSKFIVSVFMDHRYYAIYLAMALFISIYLLFNRKIIIYNIFYICIIVLSVFVIIINTSVNGYISFVVGILTFVFFKYKLNLKVICASFIFIILIFTASFYTNNYFEIRVKRTISDISMMYEQNLYKGSLSIRVSLFLIGTNIIKDNLILGTGISDNFSNSQFYYDKYNIENVNSELNPKYIDYHNMYIQITTMLGLLGLLLLLLLFYYIFRLKFKKQEIKYLSLVFLSMFLILSFGDLTLHSKAGLIFFSFFSSVFLALSENRDKYLTNEGKY